MKDFELLGVTYKPAEDVPPLDIRVRTRGERGIWSEWTRLRLDPAEAPDPDSKEGRHGAVRAGTPGYYVGPANGVQVSVHAPEGRLPEDLRLDMVDPGTSDADAAVVSHRRGSTAHAAVRQPDVITRAEWGADESLRGEFSGYSDTIKAGIIHHTVTTNDYGPADVPGIIRSIYAYHTQDKGWWDIGYNFLVDKFGNIYEGRWGGIDKPVIGAHAVYYNTDTFGVTTIGDHQQAEPTRTAQEALERISAYKLDKWGRDPETTATFTICGQSHTIDRISGHRDAEYTDDTAGDDCAQDAGATLCPGQYLYDRLPAIRTGTAELIASSRNATSPEALSGDFNGDTFTDMVLRAPSEGVASKAHAGMLNVIPGSSSGPDTGAATAWHQASSGVPGAPEAGDRFAAATASGDFDGDGKDDLAIGVPHEILGGTAGVERGHGVAHVLYGSGNGLTTDNIQTLKIADTGGLKDDGDEFGAALAAGDFDGDGTDDLAVGVPGGGGNDDGSVVVYRGAAAGLNTNSATAYSPGHGLPSEPDLSGDAADRFGAALATGHTEGPGHDDLVIGAPMAELSGVTDSGAAFLLPGGTGGLRTADSRGFTQRTPGVPGAPERGDRFGASVAVGQLDSLNGADVAIGAPGEGVAGHADAGSVNILYADADGVSGTDAEGWHQNSWGVAGGAETGDRFGSSLAAGDFDGNGTDDLAIAVVGEDLGWASDTGAVAVFEGALGGLTDDQMWSQEGRVPGVNESGDEFGSSLSAGHFDGGDETDLAIGAAGENGDRGDARVLFGTSYLVGADSARGIGQDSAGVPGAAERGDRAGS